MFYCDGCAAKYGYPETLGRSLGNCEICKTRNVCNDLPTSTLAKYRKAISPPVKEVVVTEEDGYFDEQRG